jgi:hypothetical protein
MSTNPSARDIEKLLIEADELLRQISSDVLNEMEEEHRLQFEIHAQKLERIKSEVQGKIEKSEPYQLRHSAVGMHEAFQEITRAVGQLKKFLAGNHSDEVK